MEDVRVAIKENRFLDFKSDVLKKFGDKRGF